MIGQEKRAAAPTLPKQMRYQTALRSDDLNTLAGIRFFYPRRNQPGNDKGTERPGIASCGTQSPAKVPHFVHAPFRPIVRAMPLTRRPTDLGFGPIADDYSIQEDARPVGRVYKAVNVTQDPWAWFINGEGYRPAKGTAGSLEDALAALKAEWERQASSK